MSLTQPHEPLAVAMETPATVNTLQLALGVTIHFLIHGIDIEIRSSLVIISTSLRHPCPNS